MGHGHDKLLTYINYEQNDGEVQCQDEIRAKDRKQDPKQKTEKDKARGYLNIRDFTNLTVGFINTKFLPILPAEAGDVIDNIALR